MKKCSTAALWLAAALSTPAVAGTGCEFLPSAPDAHEVTRGDTLWDIAARFLQHPSCWPQVWERNRAQIHNPHRIYPGQIIVFDRQLGILKFGAAQATFVTDKLSPAARAEPLPAALPVPTIDPRLLALVANYRLATAGAMTGAPRILGFSDSRRVASAGDIALVEGKLPPLTELDIVRALNPVLDPDDGVVLGVPLLRVGRARLLGSDGLHRFEILQADSELMAGDLLVPVEAPTRQELLPHPAPPIDGKIAAVLRNSRWAAQRDVVAMNRGRRHGLSEGSVVSVMKPVRIAGHDARPNPPSQPIANLLVFAVFDRLSFALVMRSTEVFGANDPIATPAR
jgi:hypothetical protein